MRAGVIALREFPEEARESLADLLIVLRRGMKEEGCGPQVAQAELDRFIELLFQKSAAYRLALRLCVGRHEVIACKDVADILREAIENHMPERAASEDDEEEPDE
jgi:hypothetical protein